MMSLIAVPKSIEEKFGSACARDLFEMLKEVEASAKERTLEVLEERFERRLTEEISALRVDLHEEIVNSRAQLEEKIANNHAQLVEKIANSRADMIKWGMLFWVTQLTAMTGILFAFFRR